MTTLDYKWIKRKNGYDIYLSVSGDLSHSYDVVPEGANHVGYSFKNLKDADKGITMLKKYGFDSDAMRKWHRRYIDKTSFGYLTPKEAKPYVDDAYGEYAESLRKN